MEQKRTTPNQTTAKRTGTTVSVPRPVETKKAALAKKAAPVSKRESKRMAHRRAVREPKFITVRKERKERKPFPLGIVLVLAMITALFLFMMMNYAEIDQYNGEIRDLQNTMAKLQNEQKKLEVRLDNKDDRATFEQFAVEELGMVKADTLDKYIVTLSPSDKTEIMEYEDEEDSGFGYLLFGLAEVVQGFFGE